MAKLLSTDPVTKLERRFHWNEADESFTVETRQDVTDLADLNRAQYNATDERAGWRGDLHRVASIPLNVYMELVRTGIAHDERAFRRWLDDPDQRAFRTRPGRLSR